MERHILVSVAIIMAFILTISASNARVAQAQTGELTAQVIRDCVQLDDIITVTGRIVGVTVDAPVLIQVQDPQGNIDRIDQVEPAADGSYNYSFVGGGLMNTDGIYTVVVTYKGIRSAETTFTFRPYGGGPDWRVYAIGDGEDSHPIQYLISGCNNKITDIRPDVERTSLVISLSSESNGTISLRFGPEVLAAEDQFLAFADGIQVPLTTTSSDRSDADEFRLEFAEGTRQIEIKGDYVIPEFNSIILPILFAAVIAATLGYYRVRK